MKFRRHFFERLHAFAFSDDNLALVEQPVSVRAFTDLVWVSIGPDFKQLVEVSLVFVNLAVQHFMAKLVSRVLPLQRWFIHRLAAMDAVIELVYALVDVVAHSLNLVRYFHNKFVNCNWSLPSIRLR
jgi:hypothetical protein